MRTPGFVGYFEKPLQDAMAAGTMVTSEVELFFQDVYKRQGRGSGRRRWPGAWQYTFPSPW